jgi:hypothetical protein
MTTHRRIESVDGVAADRILLAVWASVTFLQEFRKEIQELRPAVE